MNKQTKQKVLLFMRRVDTTNLNSNNFVADYFNHFWWFTSETFRLWDSVESITRSRRYWLMQEKENNLNLWLSRSDKSKDTEQEYKNTFTRTPIWMY